jgi:hypothetical protein
MIRHIINYVLGLAILFAVSSCSTFQGRCGSHAGPYAGEDSPSLGYLEHRGRQYEVRDLMDPDYRAENDDKFIQNFKIDTTLADLSTD